MSEYTEQAEKFLQLHGLEFRAVLVGDDCPTFCEDAEAERDMDKVNVFPRKTHIHGKHYRCTISGKGRGHVSFDFWNSYADSEENAFAFGAWRGSCGHGPECLCEAKPNADGIVTVTRDNRYWDKYRVDGKYPRQARAKKRIVPTAYDLLACAQKSNPGTFENFCGDFGYDRDSRKAEAVYRAVVKEWEKVRRFFNNEELSVIQEIS